MKGQKARRKLQDIKYAEKTQTKIKQKKEKAWSLEYEAIEEKKT